MYVKTINPPVPGPGTREEYRLFLEAALGKVPAGGLAVLPGGLGLYLACSLGYADGKKDDFGGAGGRDEDESPGEGTSKGFGPDCDKGPKGDPSGNPGGGPKRFFNRAFTRGSGKKTGKGFCKSSGEDSPERFFRAYKNYTLLPPSFLEEFLALHRAAAAQAGVYLVPGTYALRDEGAESFFLASSLLSPGGEVLLTQKQVFLSRLERELGFCRGDTLEVTRLGIGGEAARGQPGGFTLGLIPGTDAFYPETGRILALKGANLFCHPGSLGAAEGPWVQVAGMWQQVQQNQVFCVESQLKADVAGISFGLPSLIHGPCEMTEGKDGILARGKEPGEPAAFFLNDGERLESIKEYSVLTLLNPSAYGPLGDGGEGGEPSC